MNELISWLRTQLDADEQAAEAAGPRSWYFDMIEDEAEPFVDLALNKDRVLRQVQAHRAILDEHPSSQGWSYDATGKLSAGPICRTCAGTDCCGDFEGDVYPCKTLRALASIYSDRDGYKEEWSA